MRIQVGIVGGFAHTSSPQSLISLWTLGAEIGRCRLALVYEALSALALDVAEVAREFGARTVAISPATSAGEHELVVGPLGENELVLFIGSKPSECQRMVVDSSDILVFAGGESDLLQLFDYAQEQGKTIGILVGTGGICDDVETVKVHFVGGHGGVVVCESDPARLLDNLLALTRTPGGEGYSRRKPAAISPNRRRRKMFGGTRSPAHLRNA